MLRSLPSTPTTAPAQASARRSNTPAAPKLRESCDPCAAAKVKCDKEKPKCRRCATRHMTCEYFITKRAGRKHATRPNAITTATTTTTNPINTTSNKPISFASSESDTFTLPTLIQPSPKQSTPSYPNELPYVLSPTDPASWLTHTSSCDDIDDFLASPIFSSTRETFVPETLSHNAFDSGGRNDGLQDVHNTQTSNFITFEDAFSFMEKAISEPPTLSKPSSPTGCRSSLLSDAQSLRSFGVSDSACCCLVNALILLKQLAPSTSAACTRLKKPSYEDIIWQTSTIQSILVENEQTIEATSTMLQCPCSQDSYLLAIISLITFKVLSWYAAATAAEETSMKDGSQSPTTSSQPDPRRQKPSFHPERGLQSATVANSGCSIDGDDQSRMADRLVLNELHRAQQLVNLLSTRLKTRAEGQDVPGDGDPNPFPFSATMLNQLESDLRNRLRGLSLDIVDRLRRE